MPASKTSSIPLSEHCPWGIALIEHSSGTVLAANRYMQSVYGCVEASKLYEHFTLSAESPLSAKIVALQAGEKWNARIYPKANKFGISSVEVVCERSLDEPNQVWIYALEHPMVQDEVRFSSRSELKMLSVLLDNTLEYIFFRDLQGNFILSNEAFRTAVAVDDRTPDVNNKIEDFVSEKSADWLKSLDARMLESGHPVVNEVSLVIFQNGTKHWIQLTTVPVRNGGGAIIGSLSVARDISDLKRTESELRSAVVEAHEASRVKGDFLAAMSHEIRTPINGIIGASELCLETPLDIEQRDYLDTVIKCGSTLLNLVNNVLDFSKIEAGQLNLEILKFNPRSLIESVAKEFTQAARTKNIELVAGYDAELPEYMLGDPGRLKQIFYNLVGNAVKFTEKGEITILAEIEELGEDAARVLFSVTDTGIGISESRQEAIFRSFTQADMSTTRKYGGSGLGLSICKDLVQLMNGSIQVKSEPGQGSRFEFEITFQLSERAGARSKPPTRSPFGVLSRQRSLHILLVEDNPINQNLAMRRLQKLGHRVSFAENGHEAVEKATSEHFDCILMDIQMPDMDGFEATRQIRTHEQRVNMTRHYIVAMTAHAMKGDRDRCLDAGMDNYIPKPFRVELLKEVLGQAASFREETAEAEPEESSFASRLKAMGVEEREDILATAPIFLSAYPKDILRLQAAVANEAFEECFSRAHTLKGVAGIFGSETCVQIAEALERASKLKNIKSVEALAVALIEAMHSLARDVESATR